MTTKDAVSRRRVTHQPAPAVTNSDADTWHNNREEIHVKDRRRARTLSAGKLRLRCLACLSPAATESERRRRRAALCKASALVVYSAALLFAGGSIGGSLRGGRFGDVLDALSLGLLPTLTGGRQSGGGEKPLTAAFVLADGDPSSSALLSDRDPRLMFYNRSAFGSSYGGLKIRATADGMARRIRGPDPDDLKADNVQPLHLRLQYDEPYDPYDDDAIRTEVFRLRNRETRKCKRAEWHKLHRPTCNNFHEVDLLGGVEVGRINYLGRGHFRQAFSMNLTSDEIVTLKTLRWRPGEEDFKESRGEKTRMDALVMERLTSSPRITNCYGHCSTSIVVESLPGEIWDPVVPTSREVDKKDLNDRDDVDNKNGMTPTEKLQLALDISEALSELHGFKDGVIVHDDIDLGQFLRTPEGKVKLNDFNRAKPMLWDGTEGKYCKYYNGHIGGKMRSPEEFTEPPSILNEKIDIYSMGNNFYGILTGLWPFYLYVDSVAQKKMVRGERPFIDPRWRKRSFAERKLIEVIERCWIHDPNERTDIFWVVEFLRKAVADNAKQGQDSGA